MQLIATNKEEQNVALLDPWSAVHAAMGLALGLMGFGPGVALGGAIVYELLEQPFERAEFGRNIFNVSRPETAANSVADIVVLMIGYEAGRRWNKSRRP